MLLRTAKGKIEEKKWTAPGGKIEKKETPNQGVIREVFEETALRISEEQLIDLGLYYIRLKELDYSLEIFKTHLRFSPKNIYLSPKEHDQYQWVKIEDALDLPLVKEGDQCIKTAFNEVLAH